MPEVQVNERPAYKTGTPFVAAVVVIDCEKLKMISGMIVMALVTILVVFVATKLVPFFVTRWTWRRQLDPHFAHWPISWITGNVTQVTQRVCVCKCR